MPVPELIRLLQEQPVYRKRIAHIESFPAREAEYGTLDTPLPESLSAYLAGKRIRLYSHQCAAINAIRTGKDTIITTPTASGKTLAFALPVFERLELDPEARALFLYPTKALTNDQLGSFKEIEKFTGIPAQAAIYDGDTPQGNRASIRELSRLILSNPHELHQVLSWHNRWRTFFSGLRFVVIDEAHRYRGVFGSNIALVVRRLRRIARFYGSDPIFILSTATLANPDEFAYRLTGREATLVDADGSPRGRKHFVLYNPNFSGISERSTHQETKDILVSCVREAIPTLCFTVSRKMTELVSLWARNDLRQVAPGKQDCVTAYRAGYLPEERRVIERRLKSGDLSAVVSTNALELGIDIGGLDAVIISGYPGTMMATWQQAGRAGRSGAESVAVLIGFEGPLDQYFMHHPDQFFGRAHEHAIIDTENPYILSGHLLCAAAELPLAEADLPLFGGECGEMIRVLAEHRLLRKTLKGWVYTGRGKAAEAVKLDSISTDTFRVTCSGRLLETIDRPHAFREAHQGAVLLHQGDSYLVREMDLEGGVIRVTETDVDYYTQAMHDVDLAIRDRKKACDRSGITLSFGDVDVSERFFAYKVKRFDTILDVVPLDLPPIQFGTKALWFTIPEEIERKVLAENLDFAGGLHAVEHALIALMPFHVVCDRWDIGGLSTPAYGEENIPTIFIYDGYEGGIGLSEKAYDLFPGLVSMARKLVEDCPCESGCPSCVYSPKCGNDNHPMDKQAAILILRELEARLLPAPEGAPLPQEGQELPGAPALRTVPCNP
ncbi:MAG: DEAD/DEAH box helicase [Methanoregulaceae archaeon]